MSARGESSPALFLPPSAGITERTVAAWKQLGEKDLLPKNMGKAIGEQILAAAKSVGRAITSGPGPSRAR